MPVISVTVREKRAAAQGAPVIVCGNSDYTVTFDFDAEWDAYPQKTARFAYYAEGQLRFRDVLFEGDSVSVPILHDVREVAVGVFAGDLRTTTPARIPCAKAITDGAPVHDPPAPDVYDQLMELIAGMQGGGTAAVRSCNIVSARVMSGIAERIEE